MNTPTGILSKEHQCTACFMQFSSKRGLNIHYGRMHPSDSHGNFLETPMSGTGQISKPEEIDIEINVEISNYFSSIDESIDESIDHSKPLALGFTDSSLEEKKEFDKIQLLFNPGEIELAKFGMDHNLSQATLRDFVKLGRSLSSDGHFESIRTPSVIFRKLNSYYDEQMGDSSVINVKRISSEWLRKPITFAFESPLLMIRSLIRERRVSLSEMLLSVNRTYDKSGHETWSDLNTSSWYRKIYDEYEEDILKNNVILCPVILYSDSTLVDKLMKRRVHPIIIQIGIHSYKQRNLLVTKRILGYLPEVTKADVFDDKYLSSVRRTIFHESWKVLMEDLRPGVVVQEQLRGEGLVKNFCLYPAFFIADHPERLMIGCLRQSSRSNRPCPNCLVTLNELKEFGPCSIGDKRIEYQMTELRHGSSEEILKSYSIHKHAPFGIGKFPALDGGLYDALVPCLMHTFGRITLYLLRNIFDAVEVYGIRPKGERRKGKRMAKRKIDGNRVQELDHSSEDLDSDFSTESLSKSRVSHTESESFKTKSLRIAEFENRFSRIPYFTSHGKTTLVFRNNVSTLANLTAREKKSILFQLKFVLGSDPSTFLPEEVASKIYMVISAWCVVCKLVWTESGTKEFGSDFRKQFDGAYKDFIRIYKDVFCLDSQEIAGKILFHAAAHLPDYVEVFGNPKNWTSDSLETAHGPLSKRVFQRTQRQHDATEQILKVHRRYRAIVDIMGKEEAYCLQVKQREIEDETKELDMRPKDISKAKVHGKRSSAPDIVPLQRIRPLLHQMFESRGLIDVDVNSVKYNARSSVVVEGIGKLVAMESFGKRKSERYPTVFIHPGSEKGLSMNELREWDIHQLSSQLKEEKLFLGKIFTFLELHGTGNRKIDGLLCAVYVYFELVDKNSVYHDLIEEPHIVYSTDPENSSFKGRKYWWDIALVDEIIRPVHIIPDFADKDERRAFIDSYPILH